MRRRGSARCHVCGSPHVHRIAGTEVDPPSCSVCYHLEVEATTWPPLDADIEGWYQARAGHFGIGLTGDALLDRRMSVVRSLGRSKG